MRLEASAGRGILETERMKSSAARFLSLVAAMVVIFGAVAAVLVRVIPGPHKGIDYLVIGTLATFASLAALFVVLVTTWLKSSNLFFGRKKDG